MKHPLIPAEGEYEKPGEGVFGSVGRLFLNAGSSVVEILGGLVPGSRRKPFQRPDPHHFRDASRHSTPWLVQESFVISDEDEPPPLESSRDPTPRKNYPFIANELENSRNSKQSRAFYSGRDVDYPQQQQQHQVQNFKKHHQYYQKQHPPDAQTYYEENLEKNEIVFGAVQEQDAPRETMVIKAVDYGDPIYSNYNIRSRYNYIGYSQGY